MIIAYLFTLPDTSDTEAPFLDLNLSILNGFVSSKIYDKRDDFDFNIVNFPFLDGDVPRSTSYGVYTLWFLTVTCSCCLYLYFGSAVMLVTYFR